MKITDAKWTPKINKLEIQCECGNVFWVRADRWFPTCPSCKDTGNLTKMREEVKL